MNVPPEAMKPSIDWLLDNAGRYGRDPSELEFWTRIDILGGDASITAASSHVHGTPSASQNVPEPDIGAIVETLRGYQAIGNFPEFALTFPWRSPAEYVERLEWFAAEVMPALD